MKDELLEQAKEWSRKQGFVSVSYLQRIMRIGYTRAARLVDYMIEDGFCQNEYMAGAGHRQIIEAVEHSVQPTPLGDGDSAPEYGTGDWMSGR